MPAWRRAGTITRALYDQIVEHSRADHPDEACGVVAGPVG
ncbi:Mov34/MPN/PAD-1 family protein, partial [Streptomyces sp. NPDC048659]